MATTEAVGIAPGMVARLRHRERLSTGVRRIARQLIRRALFDLSRTSQTPQACLCDAQISIKPLVDLLALSRAGLDERSSYDADFRHIEQLRLTMVEAEDLCFSSELDEAGLKVLCGSFASALNEGALRDVALEVRGLSSTAQLCALQEQAIAILQMLHDRIAEWRFSGADFSVGLSVLAETARELRLLSREGDWEGDASALDAWMGAYRLCACASDLLPEGLEGLSRFDCDPCRDVVPLHGQIRFIDLVLKVLQARAGDGDIPVDQIRAVLQAERTRLMGELQKLVHIASCLGSEDASEGLLEAPSI